MTDGAPGSARRYRSDGPTVLPPSANAHEAAVDLIEATRVAVPYGHRVPLPAVVACSDGGDPLVWAWAPPPPLAVLLGGAP